MVHPGTSWGPRGSLKRTQRMGGGARLRAPQLCPQPQAGRPLFATLSHSVPEVRGGRGPLPGSGWCVHLLRGSQGGGQVLTSPALPNIAPCCL